MIKKQVLKSAVEAAAPAAISSNDPKSNNLFMSVNTFNAEGKTVGERIVDLYHFGTRNWLQNHTWWAMHNSCDVETKRATPEQVDAYIASTRQALADKFNGTAPAEPAAAAA